jgi:ribosome biogenesis GTPase
VKSDHFELTGIVSRKNPASYTVQVDGRSLTCILTTTLLKGGRTEHTKNERKSRASQGEDRRGDPLAVGDQVRLIETQPEAGTILSVLPRRNYLARRSAVPMPTARPHEQVVAANLDQALPVFAAASPAPKWGLLDRYLVSAEAAGIPACVCLTKVDLRQDGQGKLDPELAAVVAAYRRIGYPVLLTSAVTGEGLDVLRKALQNKTSVLLGKSGVGKTTLLNALQPGLGLKVNAVSQATGKGKHTTTNPELFGLDFGGAIVDTPGVREFGLWEVNEDDLALFFPEMREYVGKCRFRLDCRHNEEPGCAIRKAVTAGEVSPHRYASLQRLMAETIQGGAP